MNKSIENKWVQLALYIMITIGVALILIPLLDYGYSLLTNNNFSYSIHDHLQRPFEFGVIFGIVSWVVQNGIKKKKDENK